ncbi:hypothetical protein GJAV_G00092280, partial [Gymnothorax javanicus]
LTWPASSSSCICVANRCEPQQKQLRGEKRAATSRKSGAWRNVCRSSFQTPPFMRPSSDHTSLEGLSFDDALVFVRRTVTRRCQLAVGFWGQMGFCCFGGMLAGVVHTSLLFHTCLELLPANARSAGRHQPKFSACQIYHTEHLTSPEGTLLSLGAPVRETLL